MTPPEMQIFARLAGRADSHDSPIVLEERAIAPIDNTNAAELPLSLQSLDDRVDILEALQDAGAATVNQLETQLDQFIQASEPVSVLAQSLAQTKADVEQLKTLQDTVTLSPADVLSDVIKPTKLGSADELLDSDFTQVSATNGFVRSFKNLGTRPKNLLNLDGLGATATVLKKKTGNVNEIKGFVSITSNTGITQINSLANMNLDELPKTELDPVEIKELTTFNPLNIVDKYVVTLAGNLTGSRTVSINASSFNGAFSGATSGTSAGYCLKQDSATQKWMLMSQVANGTYTNVNTSSHFNNTPLTSGQSVEVLFSGSNTFMKLQFDGTGYYYVSPSSLLAETILVEDAKLAPTGGVRPLYLIKASAVPSTLSESSHQSVSLVKPTSTEYYRLKSLPRMLKITASTGSVSTDVGSIVYFIIDNQIVSQAAGLTAPRVRLETNRWLFITSTKKIITNLSASEYGSPNSGYYRYDNNLIKLLKPSSNVKDGASVIFDQSEGEVVNYVFKIHNNVAHGKVTVPTLTSASGMIAHLNTLLVIDPVQNSSSIVAVDMYVDSDMILKDGNDVAITSYSGLYWIKGDTNFPRANKLYMIDSTGLCALYNDLAYMEIEEDDSAFGIRVWYQSIAGAPTPLAPNEYINPSANRVFKVEASLPTGNYGANNLIVDLAQSGALLQVQRTRNGLINAPLLSDGDLSRIIGTEALSNVNKYMTMGFIASGKTTILEIAKLGGIEIINNVSTSYSGKFIRVASGADEYELVYVETGGSYAYSTSNSLISNSVIVQVSSILYTIDTANNNKLIKAVSGYVFNDDEEQKDLRIIKSDGSLSDPISASSSIRHFSWDVNSARAVSSSFEVFFVDTNNAGVLIPTKGNFAYPHYEFNSGLTTFKNTVYLVEILDISSNDDEENMFNGKSSSMKKLNMATGIASDMDHTTPNLRFPASVFDANEFSGVRAANQSVYWNLQGTNNSPHSNRIVKDTSGVKYTTDSFGMRSSTPLTINGTYFTDPSNALFFGVGGALNSTVSETFSKNYLDYEDILSRSNIGSGDKSSVILGKYFVIFTDNNFRPRYFNNGRMVLLAPGSLIAVASSAPAQSPDHAHNGLKMWGKDATGMFNRWLNMQNDAARQSSDVAIGDVVDVIEYSNLNAKPFVAESIVEFPTTNEAANHVLNPSGSGIVTKGLIDAIVTAFGAITPINNNVGGVDGDLFYNTGDTKLYKRGVGSTGTWANSFTDITFLLGNYLFYHESGSTTKTIVGVPKNILALESLTKPKGFYKVTTAGANNTAVPNTTQSNSALVTRLADSDYVFETGDLRLWHNLKPVESQKIDLVSYKLGMSGTSGTNGAAAGAPTAINSNYGTYFLNTTDMKVYLNKVVGAAWDAYGVTGDLFYDTGANKLYKKGSAGTWAVTGAAGDNFLSIFDNKLYSNTAGTWAVTAAADKHFLYDGKIYVSANAAAATGKGLTIGDIIKNTDGSYLIANTGGATTALTLGDATEAVIPSDVIYNTITVNYAAKATGAVGTYTIDSSDWKLYEYLALNTATQVTALKYFVYSSKLAQTDSTNAVKGVVTGANEKSYAKLPDGTLYSVGTGGTATALSSATAVGPSVTALTAGQVGAAINTQKLVAITSGSGTPTGGVNGDFYLKTADNKLYTNTAGTWAAVAATGKFFMYNNKLYQSAANSAATGVAATTVGLTYLGTNGIYYAATSTGATTALDLSSTPTVEAGAPLSPVASYLSSDFEVISSTEKADRFVSYDIKLYQVGGNINHAAAGKATQQSTNTSEIIRLSTGNLKEVSSGTSATTTIVWSPDQSIYTIVDNEHMLVQLDDTIKKLKQRDGTFYTINPTAASANNYVLVIDGIVQDNRAPRGTRVYTDAGMFIRTGYSLAQKVQRDKEIAAGSTKSALVAEDKWA